RHVRKIGGQTLGQITRLAIRTLSFLHLTRRAQERAKAEVTVGQSPAILCDVGKVGSELGEERQGTPIGLKRLGRLSSLLEFLGERQVRSPGAAPRDQIGRGDWTSQGLKCGWANRIQTPIGSRLFRHAVAAKLMRQTFDLGS